MSELNRDFTTRQRLLLSGLLVLIVVSAVGVINSVHLVRLGFADLQSIETDRDALESEYERLLLEQGAFADFARIDSVARESLGMYTPPTRDVVIMRRQQ